MFLLSDLFRDYLIVFLQASFIALGVLFAYVLIRHAVASWREQRETRLRALYQPDVDAVLSAQRPADLEAAIARLSPAPSRHLDADRRAPDQAAAGGIGLAGRRGAGRRAGRSG